MKKNIIRNRVLIIVFLFLACICFYSLRLMEIQVVDGKEYVDKLNKGTSVSQKTKAARGEIVDREGRPFTYNRVGYNITFDRVYMSKKEENETILKACKLLENTGEEWVDNLPLTKEAPFEFLPDREKDVERLKKHLNIGQYATADDVVYWLRDVYKLKDYSDSDFRKLAGVKYEMQQKGFNYSTKYTFAYDISLRTATLVREWGYEMDGVSISESAIREYMDGDLIPHVIGRIGPIYAEEMEELLDKGYQPSDYIGKDGIELIYEDYLRGKDGMKRIYFNAEGDVIDSIDEKETIPGNTVVLTIDKDIQRIAIESLKKQIEHLNETAPEGKGKEADAGAAVAIDVKTGEVLCLVTYPSYDQANYGKDYNELLADPLKPLYNRATLGRYAPGSIFKPVVGLGALNEGIETPDSRITCNHVYDYYPNTVFTCLGYHGPLTVKEALKYSCNIYFYDAGRRIGIDKINEYAHRLGLGEPTGIEINEFRGVVSNPEVAKKNGVPWNPGDVLQSSIGQMYNEFSPLQLANYTSVLASNGKRMNVNIVKSIESYNRDKIILDNKPRVVSEMEDVPLEYFEAIREGMVMASRSGTAIATFGNYFLDVAAKTGTPQTAGFPNSTFICYAPAEDPEIAVAVVIEKGWHGYTGAPVARDIMNKYFEKYSEHIPPEVIAAREEEERAKLEKENSENNSEENEEDNSSESSSEE